MHEQAQNARRLLHSSHIVSERHAMLRPLVATNGNTDIAICIVCLNVL